MAEAIGTIIFGAAIAATPLITVGATTVLTLGTAVGTAVLVGGSIGLQLLTAPDTPSIADTPQRQTPSGQAALPRPDAGHVPLRQAIPPRTVAYGRVRLAGTYVLFEASDGVSWDVIGIHHGLIQGFAGFYLHDDAVQVTTPSGGTVQGLIDGRYGGGHVNIDTRIGFEPNVAYPQPTAAMPEIWGDAYRGDGIASLMLQCLPTTDPSEFSVVYPRGKPEPSAVIDARPILDHRNGSVTANKNPVVQLVDYLTNDDYGMGFDFDELIAPVIEDIKAEANLCEGIVLRSDGFGEYRYQSSGSFQLDSDPADVVGAILDTCDGWLSENGDGTLALKVGVYRAPTVIFEGRHIRGINLQFDLADEETINQLAVDYCEPRLDYKVAPTDPWRNEADIAERGRVRSQQFSLPWVQSWTQARRLAKRRDAQNNAELRGTITTTLYGLRALGERWVRVQAPELPEMDDLVIEIRSVTIDLLNATLTFKFISVDEDTIDAWDISEEGDDITIPPKLIEATPPPIDPGGGDTGLNPRIDPIFNPEFGNASFAGITIDDPHRSDITYQTQFRVNGSGSGFTLEANRPATSPSPVEPSNPERIFVRCLFAANGAFSATSYEVQIRTVPPGGAGFASAWSASLFVTTG